MRQKTSETFRFGPFLLDADERRLTRDGQRVAIQDKPLEALLELLRHAGSLVTREELAATLWEPGVYVDTDAGLNTAVRKLRLALGDTSVDPRFVETVPRHGYRFVEAVERSTTLWTPRQPRGNWPTLVAAALGLAGGMIVTGLSVRDDAPGPSPDPASGREATRAASLQCADETTVRVAVLPFEPQGPRADHPSRLEEALTEDVVGGLWGVDGIRLAARRVTVGESLAVPESEVVLAGRVAVGGEEISLTILLLEPKSRDVVWQRTFVAPARQPYLLRRQVSVAVASFLGETVS